MTPSHSNTVWSIILAGGEGERTRPFIQEWLGCSKPKQYCTFVGSRSMLQHTLDRADRLGKPHQKITVVAEQHLPYARETFNKQQAGEMILQPQNCNTAAGIFLPLTYVRARDPNATVAIFPSDHFVFPEDRFVETVRRATRAIQVLQGSHTTSGRTRPTHMELDYGWVNVGGILGWNGGFPVFDRWIRFLKSPAHSKPYKPWRMERSGIPWCWWRKWIPSGSWVGNVSPLSWNGLNG